jgi:pimeloyl-ACP methyl ester carboxylesterase
MSAMNGAIVDNLLAGARRRRAIARGAVLENAHYVQMRAALLRVIDTGGNKPVLLLAPDGPSVIEHYVTLIDRLSGDFRVVCLDLPGNGFSFPSLGYGFDVAETADLIVELLNHLAIPRAAIAFTCANGFFAMNVAARHPDRVSHLILAQTPSIASMLGWVAQNIPGVLRVPYIGQVANATVLQPLFLATKWYDRALPRGSAHKTAFVGHSQKAIRDGGCFCLASVVQGLSRTKNVEIAGVRCPTLAIYGDHDFSHRATDFRSISDAVPQVNFVRFSGCGHFPNLEREEDYAQLVRQFVVG